MQRKKLDNKANDNYGKYMVYLSLFNLFNYASSPNKLSIPILSMNVWPVTNYLSMAMIHRSLHVADEHNAKIEDEKKH